MGLESRTRNALVACLSVACAAAALAPVALGRPAAGPPHLDKLDSSLRGVDAGKQANVAEIGEARDADVTVSAADRVLVDVYVDGDRGLAASRLAAMGMSVAAISPPPNPMVEGWLPAAVLADAAKLGIVRAVMPVIAGGADVGSVTSQGVAAHRIPQALAALPAANGAGIDVGVISDSINQVDGGIAESVGDGDLPGGGRVVVLSDDTFLPIDEGRAMAEIIFDEAPGLNRIIFGSGTAAGPAGKAASIDGLIAAGADVIADDIFWLTEPFFQDGAVAQAADRARAAGIPYFASAGNRARQSYESVYRPDGGAAPDFHDFDPGAGVDTRFSLATVPATNPDSFVQVTLQWDEAVGSVPTDIDLRLRNDSTNALLASSLGANPATGLPREVATYFNTGGSAVTVGVEIERFSGAAAPLIKFIDHDNLAGATDFIDPNDTRSDTINPDAASAQGALAVAAVSQADPGLDTPEAFSSRGPKTRFFDAAGTRLATPLVLAKPQLAAADAVSTGVLGFASFSGTSAAAPSAAGVAALLRSANPAATITEIYAQMTGLANAIDCTSTAGQPDVDCGAGFILADNAMASLDRTGPAVIALRSPASPNGKGGWYRRNVTVSWSTADGESPLEGTSGCGPTTISTDGRRTLTCVAVSGGGPGAGSITIKRDKTKPRKPKIKGIRAKNYRPGQVPARNRIKCKSKDKTSGLKSCKVKGYGRSPGKHTLRATATDKAGNKSPVRKLTYRVKP